MDHDGSIKAVNKGVSKPLSLEAFKKLYQEQSITVNTKFSKKYENYVDITSHDVKITGSYSKRIKLYNDKGEWIDTKPIHLQ